MHGTSSLTVNFANFAQNNIPAFGFKGKLNFSSNGPVFDISGQVKPESSSFSGVVSGISTSGVQGMFCGPGAKTAAGYFYAQTSDAYNYYYYTGVFGGNR